MKAWLIDILVGILDFVILLVLLLAGVGTACVAVKLIEFILL